MDDAYAVGDPGLRPGRYVRLRVSDTGTGIDPEVAARVFEPFFTTKPPGQGTGLGLATVHGIISQAGGQAHIYSEPGLGTTVTVLLPATGEAAAVAPAPAVAPARGGGEAILLAEDEESLAELIERILVRHGYQVCTATSAAEALRQASDLQQPIDLLLTDAIMPQMLGNEMAGQVRALRPGVPVLYMSGYALPVLATQGALDPYVNLLEKPFSGTTLLRRVRSALDSHTGPGNLGPSAARPPGRPVSPALSGSAERRADPLAYLLHRPLVAVRVGQEQELPAVPGVELLDLRDLDAPAGQLGPGRVDVPDDQLEPRRGAARRVRTDHGGAHHDRAGRPGRRHVHHPHVRRGLGIGIEMEPELAEVKVLRPVDVGDRHHDHFQFPVHEGCSFRLPRLGGAPGPRTELPRELRHRLPGLV